MKRTIAYCLSAVTVLPSVLPAQRIVAGRNVHISAARSEITHSETIMCANPVDPVHLLAVAHMHDVGKRTNKIALAAYASHDGGVTWAPAVDSKAFVNGAGDPACAFGRDGSVYFTALLFEALGGNETQLDVFRSKDNGRTWTAPTLASGSTGIDRAYVVVDNTGGKYDGRTYVNANMVFLERDIDNQKLPASLGLFRSLDGGATFGFPLKRELPGPTRKYVNHNGPLVVLSDGTVGWLFAQIDYSGPSRDPAFGNPNANIRFVSSPDGGETLTQAVTVSDMHYYWDAMDVAIPALAVDPGSSHFKDRLYAAWVDGRTGKSELMVAYSSDKGKTWSAPRVVSDAKAFGSTVRGPDATLPMVAVNKAGIVGVAWYDRRETVPANELGWRIRFSASLDGGDTWLPSVVVTDETERKISGILLENTTAEPDTTPQTGTPKPIALRLSNEWPGHTSGLAADAAGNFHPLWIDGRTGVSQMWTSTVHVEGTVRSNGYEALAGLQDRSREVSVSLTGGVYDPVKNIITVNVTVTNKSSSSIAGPFMLRALTARSRLGGVQIANADASTGTSGLWNLNVEGSLASGASTRSRTLQFKVIDLDPHASEKSQALLELEARVYAK